MKRYLSRRTFFKQVMKEGEQQEPQERQWASQRAAALKTILVSMYGTAGCCWSRFGNVLTFEEVNRTSRKIMINTKELALSMGFQVVYADTDAVFVTKPSATSQDYLDAAQLISKKTGLCISLSYHFKFLVLLAIEANDKMDALKRYFGITYDGEVIARGIEMRRHDIPVFIKAFQENLIKTLLQGDTINDVHDTGLEKALDLVTNSIDVIMTGDDELKISDLVITKTMGREVSKYNALFPHVSAALQLNYKGKTVRRGDSVGFIFTDSKHKNPLQRVRAIDAIENGDVQSDLADQYDREKYLQLLLDAAETVLAPFGFDRKLLGDGKARIMDWREELRKERKVSIELERESG